MCRLLAQAGLHPVDCDRVYGQLTVPGAPLLQDTAAAFGQEIIRTAPWTAKPWQPKLLPPLPLRKSWIR